MYFLAKVHGKHLIDPFQDDQNIDFGSDSGSDNPYEKDSQDSNRESAEQNDYPDEELGSDSDYGHMNHSSEDSEEKERKRKKRKEEQKPLAAKWLDILLRKQKNGVTQVKTIQQQLESNLNGDVSSDDYGMEEEHIDRCDDDDF